ncbi:MAG: hypothetical protein QOF02_2230 [Blastocatellia bacterium]|jgi:hypothetical protein|nr:hypothetical protein [Blastocatellia bacterium]
MDEESNAGGPPSSIKPPMIKPPMAAPSPYAASPQPAPPMASRSPQQAPPEAAAGGSNKLIMVINFILLAALIVGLAILAYRWLR